MDEDQLFSIWKIAEKESKGIEETTAKIIPLLFYQKSSGVCSEHQKQLIFNTETKPLSKPSRVEGKLIVCSEYILDQFAIAIF